MPSFSVEFPGTSCKAQIANLLPLWAAACDQALYRRVHPHTSLVISSCWEGNSYKKAGARTLGMPALLPWLAPAADSLSCCGSRLFMGQIQPASQRLPTPALKHPVLASLTKYRSNIICRKIKVKSWVPIHMLGGGCILIRAFPGGLL